MKQSQLLFQTFREIPKDAEVISHQLMLRSGMLQKLASGIYSYYPLLLKSIRKFEAIVREELERAGCQEVLLPMVQPSELWIESGRWGAYGKELLRFKDRKDNDFCLGPTHEEVITEMVRKTIKSYKQLPLNVFQIQTKFRDEIRPRFGLMRGREFIMKDGYSFHTSEADADREYWHMFETYQKIFSRIGLAYRSVEADSGAIGGSFTHEFHVLAQSGEDAILSCDSCEYTSNIEKTECAPTVGVHSGPPVPLQKNYFKTPNIVGQVEQAKAMVDGDHPEGMPLKQTTKIFIYRQINSSDESSLVAFILRGDHDLNLVKAKNLLACRDLELLNIGEAEGLAGCRSGFMGPIGLGPVRFIADQALEHSINLTCGANQNDFHHFGFTPSRDLVDKTFADIRNALDSDSCPRCGQGKFQLFRGIEVGQVFKLGQKYSSAMDCVFLDADGTQHPMTMGCYGIGITRTIAACLEQNHDKDGIIWPWNLAPYEVHILNLDPSVAEVDTASERVYQLLSDAGFDCLVDDRPGLSPGAKFKDADLLGMPLRITIGSKGLKDNSIEVKVRKTKEIHKTTIDEVAALVKTLSGA